MSIYSIKATVRIAGTNAPGIDRLTHVPCAAGAERAVQTLADTYRSRGMEIVGEVHTVELTVVTR